MRVAGVLESPNLVIKNASNCSQLMIDPYGRLKYQVEDLPSKV